MKASRFSDVQKAFILKQGTDGMPVADICRKTGDPLQLEASIRWIAADRDASTEAAQGRKQQAAEGGG
jgi:hypothetical protein